MKNNDIITGRKITNNNSSRFLSSVLLKRYGEARCKYNKLVQTFLKGDTVGSQVTYHHELNKINQFYPSFGLFLKKRMLVLSNENISAMTEYFSRIGIQVSRASEALSQDKTDENPVGYELVFCNLADTNITSKAEAVQTLTQALQNTVTSQTLALRFEGLPLTCFWHGIFFLLSQMFMNVIFVPSCWSKDVYFIIFNDCTGDSRLITGLKEHLCKLRDQLEKLPDDFDVFHVVDIGVFMQSNYRTYMLQRVEHLAQQFSDSISKLYS